MRNERTRRAIRLGRGVVCVSAMVLVLGLVVPALIPSPADAVAVTKPLVVVLCKFSDQTAEPHAVSYYEDLFTASGAGKKGAFDYWKDVSYGDLDLTGTVVKGWYTAAMTVAAFNTAARPDQIDTCAKAADADVDYTKFAGVIVLSLIHI